MKWAVDQQAELSREYGRIGYVPGEQWAAPPPELTPQQLLALMQTIPDGAGHAGWLVALRRNARSDCNG